MTEMTHRELLRRFPNCSKSTLAANFGEVDIETVRAGKDAVAKSDPCTGALGKGETKETDPRRFLVRIVSVRKRLGDPDGLVCKWHLDSLRYAGIISDDTAKVLDLQVSQRKCYKGEEEHTEIQVYQIT